MKKKTTIRTFQSAGLILAVALVFSLVHSPAFAFTINAENTEVQIGGYIKAMLSYDIDNKVAGADALPMQGDVLDPYSVVLDGDESGNDERDDLRFQARESRLFVKTKTNTQHGAVGTHFEGDFYGDGGNENWSNSRPFRLRHAYGTLAKENSILLVGQTWSTFMDLPGSTPAMDFNGDVGTAFIRQAMVQYTYKFGKTNDLSLALENPDRGLVIPPYFVNAGEDENQSPDVIVKYWLAGGWGHISPKLLVRRYNLDQEEATAVCGSLTGHLDLSTHKLFFGALYGDGMGRYGGLGVTSGAGLTADGDLELIPFMGGYVGARLAITQTVGFVAGYGYTKVDKDAYEGSDAVLTGAANHITTSLRAFVTYTPDPIIEYAFGAAHAERETMSGAEGDGTRIQGYLKLSF